ncbi:MAG: HEAT repeat domain-containing protein [Bacteroidota bacterium]|nr:HEAT repeat domain-containing protein [Bacteroidota bacterium]
MHISEVILQGRIFSGLILLDNPFTNVLTKYISDYYLISGVKVMWIMIAIVVLVIYGYLYNKKRNFQYKRRISEKLEIWISDIIMEESIENIVIPQRFYKMMNNPIIRQYTIDELIGCKKNFSGAVGENIVALYIQLGLKEDSIRKLKSNKKWHIKAKGIQELYMMDQMDMLTNIYRNTNSINEYVRMEAQTGIIHLAGYPGLRFLDVASYPITEWQQLKLLEQLRLTTKREDLSEKIPKWVLSKNDTVVIFALKLADEYQYFSVKPHVLQCLVHKSASVRSQAMKTLVRLADENTAMLLLGYIHKESFANQVYILDALRGMASEREKEALLRLFNHPNDIIKLKAALVIGSCCTDGLQVLEEKARETPEPYERILLHVQSELKR